MDARGKCGCGHPILHKIHRFAKRRILLQDMVLRLKTLRGEVKEDNHLDNLYTYCDLQQIEFCVHNLPHN